MVHNPEKLDKARDFRRRGFSYSEISKLVGVSKATLSNWFRSQSFSKKVRRDNEIKARKDNVKRISLVNKARSKERTKHYRVAASMALTEYKHYKSSPLFLVGLGLYLAVGDLTHPSQIRLPSQRAYAHQVFKRFLKEFLGVPKQKIYSTNAVTILNDVAAKKKLLIWIDRFR